MDKKVVIYSLTEDRCEQLIQGLNIREAKIHVETKYFTVDLTADVNPSIMPPEPGFVAAECLFLDLEALRSTDWVEILNSENRPELVALLNWAREETVSDELRQLWSELRYTELVNMIPEPNDGEDDDSFDVDGIARLQQILSNHPWVEPGHNSSSKTSEMTDNITSRVPVDFGGDGEDFLSLMARLPALAEQAKDLPWEQRRALADKLMLEEILPVLSGFGIDDFPTSDEEEPAEK